MIRDVRLCDSCHHFFTIGAEFTSSFPAFLTRFRLFADMQSSAKKKRRNSEGACNVCGEDFGEDGYCPNLHYEKRSDGLWHCAVEGCKKTFAKKFDVKRHSCVHTGSKPHKCDAPGCDYACATSGNLASHKKHMHTKEKPHKCDAPGCDYACVQSGHLTVHKKFIHTKERPHKCDAPGCDYACVTPRQLTIHKRHRHGIGLLPCFVCLEEGKCKQRGQVCDECREAIAFQAHLKAPRKEGGAPTNLSDEEDDESGIVLGASQCASRRDEEKEMQEPQLMMFFFEEEEKEEEGEQMSIRDILASLRLDPLFICYAALFLDAWKQHYNS